MLRQLRLANISGVHQRKSVSQTLFNETKYAGCPIGTTHTHTHIRAQTHASTHELIDRAASLFWLGLFVPSWYLRLVRLAELSSTHCVCVRHKTRGRKEKRSDKDIQDAIVFETVKLKTLSVQVKLK